VPATDPVPLVSVDGRGARPLATGIGEVDRVLAGGLVPGSVTLLYGEPGVGKSTLLLQVLASVAETGARALLVSAEESAAQVRARAERLGEIPPDLFVVATADAGDAEAAVGAIEPALVVVDSVQTLSDPGAGSAPGAVSQVRSCAERLARLARARGPAVVLVGHVTKDGDLAGPRMLEHLVDTVLAFEGDRHHTLRLLRAVKHRFGTTGEVGLFEMADRGVRDIADPGPLLLGDRRAEVPGSAVAAIVEGRRSLVVEIQALVCAGAGGARRTAVGVDARRLATVAAVLESRAGISLAGLELFASVAGGLRANEPAADLPLALALASATTGLALPDDMVSLGEVGLAGEVRQVTGIDRRLAEAGRLGFRRALVPTSAPTGPADLELVRVASVAEAFELAVGEVRDRRHPVPPVRGGGTMPLCPTTASS
jgi:DNA repair protein RadA/Sms